MKLLLLVVAFYLGVVALMYVFQRSLLYLPSERTATPAELEAVGLSRWPEDAPYRGYLADPPSAEATIVIFHGNAGAAIDRFYYTDALSFSNARILLVEYPGYGRRPGSPSERTLVADAFETLVIARRQFPNEPLLVIGESLGAGVAAAAVATTGDSDGRQAAPHIDALLLLTPWNSLTAVASHHYRWLPVRWLLRDHYASERHLARFRGMKVVVVAEHDEIVPARFGQALHDKLPEKKQLVVVVGARHNDWLADVNRDWWQARWQALRGS